MQSGADLGIERRTQSEVRGCSSQAGERAVPGHELSTTTSRSGWVRCASLSPMQRSRQPLAIARVSQSIDAILITPQHGVKMWNDTDIPLAYFISFRSYGTWLHGDNRGSIDRFHNRYRSPYIPANKKWLHYNEQRLKAKPLLLKAAHRKSIEAAIRETCKIRNWLLQAINVRTNHVHCGVGQS
jgi:hypothetical protein